MSKWVIVRAANETGEQINALREGAPQRDQGVTMSAPVDDKLRWAATLGLAVNILNDDPDAEIAGDDVVAAAVTKERKNRSVLAAIKSGDMEEAERLSRELLLPH